VHKKNYTANFNTKQMLIDSVAIFSAFLFSDGIYYLMRGFFVGIPYIWIFFLYTTVFVLTMIVSRMYNITTFCYMSRIINRSFAAAVLSGLCIGTVVFFTGHLSSSRLFVLLFGFFGFVFVTICRLAIRWMKKNVIGNGYTHILFIGDVETKDQFLRFIYKTSMKIRVDNHICYDDPSVTNARSFENMLKSFPVEEVVFVYCGTDVCKNMKSLMGVCDEMGITVRVVLDLPDFPNSKRFVSSIGTYPVLTYHSIPYDKVSLFFKLVMDIIGAIVGLVLFSPVFLVTAIAIKLDSPGPVFFAQTRIGMNGKPFKMYKFRSMYMDADERKKEFMAQNKMKGGFMFKIDNDPRITRVGAFIRKTSIDELPQFINVLLQNMSLVGTRPPTPDEVERYDREHWRRISIKPGITGIWQTSGRSDIIDFDEVVKLDKQYIDEWSLTLDIKLLCKTVSVVLKRSGAA